MKRAMCFLVFISALWFSQLEAATLYSIETSGELPLGDNSQDDLTVFAESFGFDKVRGNENKLLFFAYKKNQVAIAKTLLKLGANPFFLICFSDNSSSADAFSDDPHSDDPNEMQAKIKFLFVANVEVSQMYRFIPDEQTFYVSLIQYFADRSYVDSRFASIMNLLKNYLKSSRKSTDSLGLTTCRSLDFEDNLLPLPTVAC